MRSEDPGQKRSEPALRGVPGGFWLIAAVAMVILFYGLGRLPLLGFSEGRYASIGAEMWRSGDWVTPRYGGVKHLEKPPLAYWGAAAAFEAGGLSEGSARMPAALAAIFLVGLTGWIATRRFGAIVGQLSALLLLTFPMHVAMGRVLFTDMILAAGCVLYVVAVLEGAGARGGKRLAWAAVSGLGIAVAILSKFHLILLVATAPLLVEAALARSRRLVWMAFHPLSWVIGVGLCLPWILAMLGDNPGLVSWVVEYQTRDRVLTEVHDRTGPPWFYLAWMPVAIFPWIFLLPAVLRAAREDDTGQGRSRNDGPARRNRSGTQEPRRAPFLGSWVPDWLRQGGASRREDETLPAGATAPHTGPPVFGRRFLWIWFLLSFVAFSLIGSKRFNYLPPILPPLAMLIALPLARDPDPSSRSSWLTTWVFRLVLGVPAAAMLVLPVVASFVDIPGVTAWVCVPGLVWAAATVTQERWLRRLREGSAPGARARPDATRPAPARVPAPLRFAFLYAGCLAILVPFVFEVADASAGRMSHHAAAASVARPYAVRDVPVVMYHLEAASTSYYLDGRPLVLVGVPRQTQFEDPEVAAARYFADDTPDEKARTGNMFATAQELIFITRKEERLAHLQRRIDLPLEVLWNERGYHVARLKRP